MSKYNYSTKMENEEHIAKVVGRDLGISTKQAIQIAKFIRNRKLETAKNMLKEVIDKKRAVPFTRFNRDMGHKAKIGPGRYPIKASKEILRLLLSVENNAQVKGLGTGDLYITRIIPQKGAIEHRHGRRYGRTMKRTHMEIIVEEKIEKKQEKKDNKETKK